MGIKLLESPRAEDGDNDAYSMTQDSSSFYQSLSTRSARSVPSTVPAAAMGEKGGSSIAPLVPEAHDEHHLQGEMVDSNARFVAGETFFNYDACGSLRPGMPEIKLFSAEYVGLAIHVTLVGFCYDFISYGYGRFLAEYFKATNQKQFNAANYVLVWPQALAVFIGLAADTFPLFDYRRKSYMVLGWLVSLTMYATIILMDLLGKNHDVAARPYAIAYLVVSLVAAFGIQIAWVSGIALSIEYAQREQIYYRGRLQATLVALYYVGKVLSKLLAALVITDDMTGNHLVSMAAIFLAGVSVFAIPFVIFRLDEVPLSKLHAPTTELLSVKARLSYFWKFCRQNLVYRVLFFLCLHLFLLGVYNQNVRDSVQKWSQVTRKTTMWIEAARMVAQVAGSLVWRSYLRNTNWRKVVVWGTTVFILVQLVLVLFTAFDLVRNQWFYAVLVVIADVPRSWLVLFSVILATEIAESGHEGISFALGLSFQSLAALAGYTLAEIFPNVFGFKVTPAQVLDDDASTRSDVAKAFAIVLAFNVVSYVTIQLVPRQKLDAQQMRAFGGYNHYGSYALLLLFAVLLCFNFAVNLAAVL